MTNIIKNEIKILLEKVGVKDSVEFSTPPKPEMGDLAFPCFEIAKQEGKSPVEVAKEVVENLKLEIRNLKLIENIKAFGPYVNFFLNTSEIARLVFENNISAENVGKDKKVLIEYPSQNTHKEFHIGHLRNVCIGNTIVKLYRESGFDITPMNYVNDFGRHVVKSLWGIENGSKFGVQRSEIDNAENKQKMLGEIYAKANTYIEENKEDITPELDELQSKLESRDPEVTKLFEETKGWSTEGFKDLMDELKTEHDSIIYESEVKGRGQEIVDELLSKKIAEEGERGAIIVDLSKDNLDIALLRKSTGGGVYMTSDLALAERKFGQYSVEESINITGTEQDHYFKQLFRVLNLNGFTHKMTHVGYGLVNLPSGKMSSRAGNVILYEDLRDEVFSHLYKETKARHEDSSSASSYAKASDDKKASADKWSEKKIEETTQVLTMASLKFTMQKHESNKIITFDMNEAVSFDGYSAPYILYVVARINSLLRDGKYVENDILYDVLCEQEEKQLLMLVADYGGVVKNALESYNPSTITRYCFDLAKSFNDFYNKHSVLNASSPDLVQARLKLCALVSGTLKKSLDLLTIDTVEEM
ncbi:arginine--tRNA ligase [Candidatus Parcubacteria bacterium]|nr:arginine--tRNA ligase [Candidatus Parcubacteria bacterium]